MHMLSDSRFSISKEFQFLIECTKTINTESSSQKLVDLACSHLNWDYVLKVATWHRLEPMVFQCLQTELKQYIQKDTLKRFQESFKKNVQHSFSLVALLMRVLELFQQQGIFILPIKGAPLAQSIYGNISLRRSRDLDLLVLPADAIKAIELLEQHLGLKREGQLTLQQLETKIQTSHEVKLFGHNLLVELHWRFAAIPVAFPFDMNDLPQRTQKIEFHGVLIPQLQWEDRLIYLCYHGSKHLWFRLFWLVDIAAILHRQSSLDWEKIFRRAVQLKQVRSLCLGLQLAHLLFEAPLPSLLIKYAAKDPALAKIVNRNLKLLCREDVSVAEYEVRLSAFHRFKGSLDIIPNVKDKFRFFATASLMPRVADLKMIALPPALFPLYLLIRPIRLIWEYLIRKKRV